MNIIFINRKIILIFLLLLFIYKINSRKIDNFLDDNLTSYQPILSNPEMKPLISSCHIVFNSPNWYKNSITYKLYISEYISDIWYKDKHIFNPKLSNDEIEKYILSNETLFKSWNLIYSGSQRICNINNLNNGSLYRIKYKIISKSSNAESLFSNIKLISLKHNIERVSLFIKGTGKNHHNNSFVKINNKIILNNGKFFGLCAIILNKKDLSVNSINYFDTYSKNEEIEEETKTYTKYSYDSKGNIQTNSDTITIKKDKILYENNKLIDLINNKIDFGQILIIVSCFGWEKYFTYETAELLTNFGALKIKELNYAFYTKNNEDKFKYNNVLGDNYYHHPFAFVGSKNLGMGNGFEVIQTNKGNYLSTENLPFAEILVTLNYNYLTHSYEFDKIQKYQENYRLINYNYLHNSLDLSLNNLISFLVHSNLTSSINSHFNIYNPIVQANIQMDFDEENDNCYFVYQTELDRVVIGNNLGSIRTDYNGDIYQGGFNVYFLEYYNFYYNVVFNGLICKPPFTPNDKECLDPNITNNYDYDIPILMCGIGIQPQICANNENYEYLFEGFN